MEECGAQARTQSRDCSLFPRSRCLWGRGEIGLVAAAGWGVGRPRCAEGPLSGRGVRSVSPRGRQLMGSLGRSENRQGPAPRPSALPGATTSRPGLCAGPGGSGQRGRRGPLRGGGWAHLPPGWPSRDFLEPPIARGA